jgi:DNA repair protein RadD
MALRDYQQDAVNAIIKDIDKPGNSLVVMPTASGKSHVIAEAARLRHPVLILQPSRELLAQNRAKLALLVDKKDIGTYSASFDEKTIRNFTFATIQSVYKKPELFSHIKLVIIDECHGLAPRALGTMYTSFITAIGSPKVIGFTATPYRLELSYFYNAAGELEAATMLKLINRMRHKSAKKMFWERIIYKVDHQYLLDKGYLSPIEYIYEPLMPYAEIPVNKSYSDYNLEAYAEAIVGREAQILSTIAEAQKRYKSLLVFCATTAQAIDLSKVIKGSGVVTGTTPKAERERIVECFKSGKIKTVFNVSCLTTGFDHPELDCILLLRPTRSLPLYNQIIGRLTRLAPGKTKGTVIDFTGTCRAMGRVETFQLYKNEFNLWDLRTEKHQKWHNKVLFSRLIEQK